MQDYIDRLNESRQRVSDYMYGGSTCRFKGFQACIPVVQYKTGCGMTWEIKWHLNHTQSLKYGEVINVNIVTY